MQSVSQEWKDNQGELLVGESDIEISLKVTDPDAYEDATATDNGSSIYGDTNHIVSDGEKNITPYATFENNQWLLDGSREILPDSNYGEVGYVGSVICSSDGTYSTNPIVFIEFSQVHNKLLQGVTIRWSEFLNEYAKAFIVTAYNGTTVVAQQTVADNATVLSVVTMDIAGYNRITIEIVKWSMAYRRPRIDDLFVGINKVFSKRDIFSYDCSQSADPISAELPKSEVSFSIDNIDETYNPYNVEGLSQYLIERQEITVKYGYKLSNGFEWINGGKYYLSEWNAKQNGMSAEFKARDLLEFMTGTYYRGLYNPSGTSLYALAEDVLQDAGLPLNSDGSVKWVIDERLKDIYTVAPLPIDTHSNCLQMIANAGECVMYQDRKGFLHIRQNVIDPATDTDYAITHFNSYSKSELSLSKPLKQVDVPCYSYSVATEKSELYKGTININGTEEVIISYSGPAINVTQKVTGGTIVNVKQYTHCCILTITGSGAVEIVVEGYTLENSSILISTTNGDMGEIVSVDNLLITSQDRAISVGNWVKTYMSNRMSLSSSWRADPRLDALDIVDNENDYGNNKVIMTNVKYTYNGAFRGSGEGRVI